ncbi:transposase [Aliikangiella sp. IMCC44632]
MPTPRRDIVDSETPGFYHCISRCVRRAYLCGRDPFTGNNCDHRKAWLERRMLTLSQVFSVELYAYAIMDNHYHLVLSIDPKAPLNWTDEQIAEKWLLAFPSKLDKPEYKAKRELKKRAIMNDPALLESYRKRLGNLSWFMACLNGPLAKTSNAEDYLKGRFWESRYQSVALLDISAVLACMAYVDLNPIRAGIVEELQNSLHTSIKKRIEQLRGEPVLLKENLKPIAQAMQIRAIQIKLKDYIELVEWTGKSIVHPGKAQMPAQVQSIITNLNLQPDQWLYQYSKLGKHSGIAIGPLNKLKNKAKQLNKCWIKGASISNLLYC